MMDIKISKDEEISRCAMTDWDALGCFITQTLARTFQTLSRAFSFLLNPQKLDRVSQMLKQVFQKLG